MAEPRQRDLFNTPAPAPRYPHAPGAKVGGTSRDSARRIASHAATVRAAVLGVYVEVYPEALTPDQVAATINESILTVRPRCSELKADGMLVNAPTTAENPTSGHQARALVATAKAREIAS